MHRKITVTPMAEGILPSPSLAQALFLLEIPHRELSIIGDVQS